MATDTIAALCRAVDLGQDDDAVLLPVLADALEEAGCTDADLLTRFRAGRRY